MSKCMKCGRPMNALEAQEYECCVACGNGHVKSFYAGAGTGNPGTFQGVGHDRVLSQAALKSGRLNHREGCVSGTRRVGPELEQAVRHRMDVGLGRSVSAGPVISTVREIRPEHSSGGEALHKPISISDAAPETIG